MSLSQREMFDTVKTHLLKQNAKAQVPSLIGGQSTLTCVYRAPNGLKCAVGAVISDDVYLPEMDEAGGVEDLVCQFPTLFDWGGPLLGMLVELQDIHDNWPV